MLCPGSTTETCGAGSRLQIYQVASGPLVTSAPTTSQPSAAPSQSPAPTVTAGPTEAGLPITYRGCYTDTVADRTLGGGVIALPDDNSIETCSNHCDTLGFSFFGLEYGVECFCGNAVNPASSVVLDTECNIYCPNSQTEFCGAGNRIQIYEFAVVVI